MLYEKYQIDIFKYYVIGVKQGSENKREFSEDTLKAGKAVIGLQMGSNRQASQKGMTAYGTGRQIIN